MEEFKGTKGNWKIGIHGTVVSDDHSQITKVDEKRGHAEVEYYGGLLICESVRSKHDAQIISASKEMFEALKGIVFWHGKRNSKEELLPIEKQDKEIQLAIKAIEKATKQ